MVDILVTHLMMPIIADFCLQYPKIQIDLDITYKSINLERREADIALRFARHPPENLIAKQLGSARVDIYAHQGYIKTHSIDEPGTVHWVGYGGIGSYSDWVKSSELSHIPAK